MKKVFLSNTDKKIAGVCGGLAETYGWDSSLVRVGVVFLALITAIFPTVITYIIASLIIPRPPVSKVHETTPEAEKTETK